MAAVNAKSLSDLFINDKILPGSSDASKFTLEMEKIFLNHKMHFQGIDVIKFWMFVFLYNFPSFLSCDTSTIVSQGYVEVLHENFKFYYVKNDTDDVLNIASFSFNKENDFPELEDEVAHQCSVLWPSLAKMIADKNRTVEFMSYKVFLVEKIPFVSVTVEKCAGTHYTISPYVALFEPIQKMDRNCVDKKPSNGFTFDSLNSQILQHLSNLFKLSKQKIVTATDFSAGDNKFLLTALNVFFVSQPDKYGDVKTEIQTDLDGDDFFEGLWVQIRGAPLMYFECDNEKNSSHRQAPHAAALISDNYLKYNVFHDWGTFMLRTCKQSHGLLNSPIASALFSYPNKVENLVTAIQGDLMVAFRNLPDLDMTKYVLGRLIGDRANTDIYDVYYDDESSIIIQSFANTVKFSFPQNSSNVQKANDACRDAFFNGQLFSFHLINIKTVVDNPTQRKLIINKSDFDKPANSTPGGQNGPSCNPLPEAITVKAVKNYELYNKAPRFFACSECIGEVVWEVTRSEKLTFHQAQSKITGILTGMFPTHSFVAKSLVIHNTDDLETVYQIEFEKAEHVKHISDTVAFWKSYDKSTNFPLKVNIIVIVLRIAVDESVGIDSICLPVDTSSAKCWNFCVQLSNKLITVNLTSLTFPLTVNNNLIDKSGHFQIEETLSLSTALSSSENDNTLSRIDDLIVYAQLGPNIALGVQEKLKKLGYDIRTDFFDKISQVTMDSTKMNDRTIALPDILINPFKDLPVEKEAPEIHASPEGNLKQNLDHLVSLAERLGTFNLEQHVNKVSQVNGIDPFQVETILTDKWEEVEASLLQKTVDDYAIVIRDVKYLTLRDIHYIVQCNTVGSTLTNPNTHHICSNTVSKSQHTMIDMTNRVFCTPERPLQTSQGASVESFQCSDDSSLVTNRVDGFANENMYSIARTKKHDSNDISLVHLSGKMSMVFGKSDMKNIFVAAEGFVTAVGGPLNDVFVLPRFDNGVRGVFDGRDGSNTLLILNEINGSSGQSRDSRIVIDTVASDIDSAMKIYQASSPNEFIRLLNFQRIIGRQLKSEELLNVGCQIRYIKLNGCNDNNSDKITIPKTDTVCTSDLRIFLDVRTVVDVDAQQERKIEYVVDNGPVKINLINNDPQHPTTLGLIVVQYDLQKFEQIKVELKANDESRNQRNIYLYLGSDQPPHVCIYNLNGRAEIRFNDYTLIMDERKHTLLKNNENHQDDMGLMSTWQIVNNIITYTFSNGNHSIDHYLRSLDDRSVDNVDYLHVFQMGHPGSYVRDDFPISLALDEVQSGQLNVLDLRPLIHKHVWGNIQISFIPGPRPGVYDEVLVWLPDKSRDEEKILVDVYLTLASTSPPFYAVTDTRLICLAPDKHDDNTNNRFNTVVFNETAKRQMLSALVFDETTIRDVYFRKIINGVMQGQYKIIRSHGNVMVKEEECDGSCSPAIILWNYDKKSRLFDKIVNLPSWIHFDIYKK